MWKYMASSWMCWIGEMATLSLSKQPCWLSLMHENADMVAPLTTADKFSLAPVVLFTHNWLQRSFVISLLSEAEIPLQKVVAHLRLHKFIYSQVEVFKKPKITRHSQIDYVETCKQTSITWYHKRGQHFCHHWAAFVSLLLRKIHQRFLVEDI